MERAPRYGRVFFIIVVLFPNSNFFGFQAQTALDDTDNRLSSFAVPVFGVRLLVIQPDFELAALPNCAHRSPSTRSLGLMITWLVTFLLALPVDSAYT